jgi:hypothetical protein
MARAASTTSSKPATTPQEMLVLAMLSYRAYHSLRPGEVQLARLYGAVEDGLATLEPLGENWELVWGPAAYRAPFTTFDENVMYLVHDRRTPNRYAVVVRGTNPVSAADWLFGDLWTGVLAPWEFGSPAEREGAAISLSTALGLNVLLHMHATGPRPGPVARIWRLADEDVGDAVRRTTRLVLRPFGGLAASTLRRLRFRLRADLRELKYLREWAVSSDPEERVDALLAFRNSTTTRRLRRRLVDIEGRLDDHSHRELLRLMEGSFRLRTRLAPGVTLFEFLEAAVSEASGPVEVVVTGHSKGGALAPTLALALAQSQGSEHIPRGRRWDPHERATVHCYAYAGPTAGNAAFADLSDRVIGANCHRIANRLDMAPHAWMTRVSAGEKGLFIDDLPDLYPAPVHHVQGLDLLARSVIDDVAPLEYQHVGNHVTILDGNIDPHRTLYFEQATYQHIEAYLEMLGLDRLGLVDFISPLR